MTVASHRSPDQSASDHPTFKVAVIQMDSGEDKEKNLARAEKAIDEAAAAGAQVLCFPENMPRVTAQGGTPVTEPLEGGPTLALLCNKAREHGVYIHGGSLTEKIEGSGRAHNTAAIVGPDGEILSTYRKLHTFDVTLPDGTPCAESSRVRPGSELSVVQTPLGRWGTAICYDLRFPELFRKMALMGAEVVFVPANFTRPTGRDHWEVLLRARAIENGCFVVAADQCGTKPDFTAFGTSLVIDPWGDVLARANADTPEIVYATLDLQRVWEVRESLPVLENRRPDVYGSLAPTPKTCETTRAE